MDKHSKNYLLLIFHCVVFAVLLLYICLLLCDCFILFLCFFRFLSSFLRGGTVLFCSCVFSGSFLLF